MKKYSIAIAAALSILILTPRASLAYFDGGFYGGYSVRNKVASEKPDIRPYGWGFGLIAHYNLDLVPDYLWFGAGAYYHRYYLIYELNNASHDYLRQSVGLDLMLEAGVKNVFYPYIRFSVPLWEQARSDNRYFEGFLAGAGFEFPIYKMVRIYCEYVLDYGVHGGDWDLGHTLNFGIRAFLTKSTRNQRRQDEPFRYPSMGGGGMGGM